MMPAETPIPASIAKPFGAEGERANHQSIIVSSEFLQLPVKSVSACF